MVPSRRASSVTCSLKRLQRQLFLPAGHRVRIGLGLKSREAPYKDQCISFQPAPDSGSHLRFPISSLQPCLGHRQRHLLLPPRQRGLSHCHTEDIKSSLTQFLRGQCLCWLWYSFLSFSCSRAFSGWKVSNLGVSPPFSTLDPLFVLPQWSGASPVLSYEQS